MSIFLRYRVLRYYSSINISIEDFASESEKFYIRPGGSRVIKEGNDYIYFETWKEARDYTLKLAKRELRNADNQIKLIESLAEPVIKVKSK